VTYENNSLVFVSRSAFHNVIHTKSNTYATLEQKM